MNIFATQPCSYMKPVLHHFYVLFRCGGRTLNPVTCASNSAWSCVRKLLAKVEQLDVRRTVFLINDLRNMSIPASLVDQLQHKATGTAYYDKYSNNSTNHTSDENNANNFLYEVTGIKRNAK